MNVNLDKKKEEALKRLKTAGIIYDARRQFADEGTVMVSEPPYGALYWLDDELKETVREFEEKYDAMVYLVIRSYTEFGKMDSLLYVSDHEDEWDYDNNDLKHGYAMTYTINYDYPDFSEFGTIGFKSISGGVVRMA